MGMMQHSLDSLALSDFHKLDASWGAQNAGIYKTNVM
jgi:hypothetical protein